MKRHIGFLSVLLVGSGALVSCQDDTEHFDNKIYNTAEQTSTVFVEEEADSYVRTLQAQLAMPADSDISFAYVADPGQVEWYNTAYSDSAGMLPADYYEIPDPEAVIPAGETASSEVEIRFRNLLSLDKTQVYVLPVSIDGADVATLASRRTVYFVVKEASLVNVVANLRENAVSVEWRNPDPLRNLRSLTAEALVKVDEFADGRGSNISTLMGVEGHFLLRFGDTAPNNQLQVVGRPAGTTVDEKLTSSDWTVKTGRWTHIAVTYDSDTHEVNVYIDGVKKTPQTFARFADLVDWGRYYATETETQRSFWIGYSYEDARYLDGDISEVRVWNKVLAEEDINGKNHFYKLYDPELNGNLVAYWKFNEGGGATVGDYSQYGNDAAATKVLTWNAVELPAK